MPKRQRSQRVEAVVLRHSDWGEADRLLWLFTREQGKVRAIAKGARKLRSRKAGHIEPFTRVTLQLATGRDLYIVTQAETLERLADPQEDVWRALRYYELRLLDFTGYRPELFHCVRCGKVIQPEDQFFSAAEGGVICPRCGAQQPDLRKITMPALKYLRHFTRSAYADVRRAQPTVAVQQEMENLIQHYVTFVLERGLNSPAFLHRIQHHSPPAARSQSGKEEPRKPK